MIKIKDLPDKTWEHNWVIHPLFGDAVTCSKCHTRKELAGSPWCYQPDLNEPGWEGAPMKYGCFLIPTIREKDFIKGKDYIGKIIKR